MILFELESYSTAPYFASNACVIAVVSAFPLTAAEIYSVTAVVSAFPLVAASIAVAATAQAVINPVAPAALRQGDTIAIISPGSTPKDGVAEAGARVLEQWGFHTVIGAHAYSKHGMYAGTKKEVNTEEDVRKMMEEKAQQEGQEASAQQEQ